MRGQNYKMIVALLFNGILCLSAATPGENVMDFDINSLTLNNTRSSLDDGHFIQMVVFVSGVPDGKSQSCELGRSDQMNSVITLPNTTGKCMPEKSYLFSRPYYMLDMYDNGTVKELNYACSDSSCKSCLFTGTEVPSGKCFVLGNNSFHIQPEESTCFGPLNITANTPADAISVVTYRGCGRDVDAIFSLGSPDETASRCLPIEGLAYTGTPRYYQLGVKDGKVTGKWMCEDEYCGTCTKQFRDLTLGTSDVMPVCSEYHQVIQTSDLKPCNEECGCAPYPPGPPGPPASSGYVYVNEYLFEANPNLNCEFGQDWEEAVVARVSEGCTRFKYTPVRLQDMYRLLELNVDGSVKTLGLYCDVGCQRCQDNYPNMEFSDCEVSDSSTSVAVYPPDRFCRGSTNMQPAANGLVISYFNGSGCDIKMDSQKFNVMHMRIYPQATGVCQRDGITREPPMYYNLKAVENKFGYVYNGVLNCSNDDCTSCTFNVSNVASDECVIADNGYSFSIGDSDMLKTCYMPKPSPTTTATRRRIMPQSASDQIIISVAVGSVLVIAAIVASVYYLRISRPKRAYREIQGSSRKSAKSRERQRLAEQAALREQRSARAGRYEYNGM
eukprot:m.42898 g.42898  ORF g.42898 m.42898 type:complete len:613 (+) comp9927_c0_seq1:266-2104(+)